MVPKFRICIYMNIIESRNSYFENKLSKKKGLKAGPRNGFFLFGVWTLNLFFMFSKPSKKYF